MWPFMGYIYWHDYSLKHLNNNLGLIHETSAKHSHKSYGNSIGNGAKRYHETMHGVSSNCYGPLIPLVHFILAGS